jgi:hypothetical protein
MGHGDELRDRGQAVTIPFAACVFLFLKQMVGIPAELGRSFVLPDVTELSRRRNRGRTLPDLT